ncbi:MAG TPA: co-chaperone DjlA [Steroidobacteraceae bacterium]|nr:co-chaperone DjlA [Steroidobacteraceae bacterium]
MTAGMKWTGKLVGGLLGMLTLGPIGAALGVLLGHQFDTQALDAGPPVDGADGDVAAIGARFFRATFHVMGCLAKADGRVSPQEIAAARAVMGELRLDAAQVREAITLFTAGKQADFDLDAELAGLRRACRGRPDVVRIFLEIQVRAALAGNDMEGPVRPLLARIAAALRISGLELAHIEAVLRIQHGAFRAAGARGGGAAARDGSLEQAYRVLETSAGASDQEVVKAYRRQLHRHHPDKLKANGLPESMLAHAKQRTQQIIEAYELIRARRGMS